MAALDKVKDWVKDNPIPTAGIAGVTLAVGAAVLARGRTKATPAGEYVIPNVLTPGALVGGGGTGFNTGGGGLGPIQQSPPFRPEPLPILRQPSEEPYRPPPSSSTSTAPTETSSTPFAIPQEASPVGVKLKEYQVTNPYGSAARLAAEHRYYTPSKSDYASEVVNPYTGTIGITRTIAAVSPAAAAAGRTYVVDNTTLGTGASVPVANRIPGEIYDALGRVIL